MLFSFFTLAVHAAPSSFSAAKRVAKKLYTDHRVTFYCQCPYNKYGKVNLKACGYQVRKNGELSDQA